MDIIAKRIYSLNMQQITHEIGNRIHNNRTYFITPAIS
jgi:hypothetical protein